MTDRDTAFREFVENYDIEVPDEMIENEMEYITLEMKHRMQYDTLTTGALHLNPGAELAEQEEQLRAAACFEAKSALVLKAVIEQRGITVTRPELEAEASAMAQRQDTTVEQVKMFFGEDLGMLEQDLKERKAIDWICEQA